MGWGGGLWEGAQCGNLNPKLMIIFIKKLEVKILISFTSSYWLLALTLPILIAPR